MKIHFYIYYRTQHGQNLSISIGETDDAKEIPLDYLNEEFWHTTLDLGKDFPKNLTYRYHFHDENGGPGGGPISKTEWDTDRQIDLSEIKSDSLKIIDHWNPAGAFENAFFTQPFKEILLNSDQQISKPSNPQKFSHIFRVKAPLLKPGEVICMLGHGLALRNWDTAAPLLLRREGNWWATRLDLSGEDFPLAYKYGVWDSLNNKFRGFEEGSNRSLYQSSGSKTLLHDGFARLPNDHWRGAGVAVPVFSLRTEKSFGVGEFADLHALVDWAKSVGLKLIQLLPVNDTSATGTWTDSYPYAAISAFALHPIYLNLETVAGKKHVAVLKPFSKKQKELNALQAVDYEAVMKEKLAAANLLFEAQKDEWLADKNWREYFSENRHWLLPYAAFCHFRDKFGTPDFNQWPGEEIGNWKQEIQGLETGNWELGVGAAAAATKSIVHHSAFLLNLFVQYHLHLQLRAATQYAHSQGVVMKGDIPIGIYRYSCDAWVAPELYNMDKQAGAPPDDFAEKGQNWGFPTYNWERMKADGFKWWRQRFEQMSLYFDAFRIDHILGFFRIWSIPLDAVEGILGRFVPCLPVRASELAPLGLDFDRVCKPFVTDDILWENFGGAAEAIREKFFEKRADGRYDFKPEFSTQRQIEGFLNRPENTPLTAHQTPLNSLISNVLLFPGEQEGEYHFRFGIEKTTSFKHLERRQQSLLKSLHDDYFYRRQDDFWQREAMEKLPALKRSTNMLICGEDLGMVPGCVPDVMRELGILSLEIQRMPKQTGTTFFHPKDAPYLSVVTPSTHDMSTIRGWWEEDRGLSQRFFNEVLGIGGDAPYFCEPWLNRSILEQHFNSPAMWAIFQLQDLMGMDGALRRENPGEERINVPANPKHYWQYRMHLTLEKLMAEERFNAGLRQLVSKSGR